MVGEADPPPRRPRHAASPSSAPDGRRTPAAGRFLLRRSVRVLHFFGGRESSLGREGATASRLFSGTLPCTWGVQKIPSEAPAACEGANRKWRNSNIGGRGCRQTPCDILRVPCPIVSAKP